MIILTRFFRKYQYLLLLAILIVFFSKAYLYASIYTEAIQFNPFTKKPDYIIENIDKADRADGKTLIWDDSDSALHYVTPTTAGGGTAGISDDAYDSVTWNDVTDTGASKNSLRDKFVLIDAILDAIPTSHDDLADTGTNDHDTIDTHLASTSDPHNTLTDDSVSDTNIDFGVGSGQVSASDMPNEDVGQVSISGGVYTVEDFTLNDDGDANSNKIINLTDPTDAQDAATKEYHDMNTGGTAFDFFLSDTADGAFSQLFSTTTGEAQSTDSVTAATAVAPGTLIEEYITESGEPTFVILSEGVYTFHTHAEVDTTSGRDKAKLIFELYSSDSAGANQVLLMTSEASSQLTTTETEYDVHAVLAAETMIGATDRLILKVYGVLVAATGSTDPVVTITMEGTGVNTTATRITVKTISTAFDDRYVKQDGTTPMTADWDIGNFDLTFKSATGDGTIEGATLTEGGNDVYSEGEIPSWGRFATWTFADDTFNVAPFIKFNSSRAADADLEDDDWLGDIRFYGRGNGTLQVGARIGAAVDGTPGTGSTDMPTELFFMTSPDGSATPVLAATMDSEQNTNFLGTISSIDFTASEIVITDASKNLVSAAVATYPSLVELAYVKGVTSAIQAQINDKADTTFTKDITIPEPDQMQGVLPDVPFFSVGSIKWPSGIQFYEMVVETDTADTFTIVLEEWTDPSDGGPVTLLTANVVNSVKQTFTVGDFSDTQAAAGSDIYLDIPTNNRTYIKVYVTGVPQ